MLTREQILECNDVKIEEVNIPEWGDSVYVRSLTGEGLDNYQKSIVRINGKYQTTDMTNVRAKLVVQTVCDKDGNLLFTKEDIPLVAKKNGAALEKLFEKAAQMSGLSNEELGDIEKN